jgi:hypothetical protein
LFSDFDFFQAASGALCDLLPNLPSSIRRVCSGYAPDWGVLATVEALDDTTMVLVTRRVQLPEI